MPAYSSFSAHHYVLTPIQTHTNRILPLDWINSQIRNPDTNHSNRYESIWHPTIRTWNGTCGTRTSSTRSTSKPCTADHSQCHSERSEDEQANPLHRRQKETRRVSDWNWHVPHHKWGYIQQRQSTNHICPVLYEGWNSRVMETVILDTG